MQVSDRDNCPEYQPKDWEMRPVFVMHRLTVVDEVEIQQIDIRNHASNKANPKILRLMNSLLNPLRQKISCRQMRNKHIRTSVHEFTRNRPLSLPQIQVSQNVLIAYIQDLTPAGLPFVFRPKQNSDPFGSEHCFVINACATVVSDEHRAFRTSYVPSCEDRES